MKTIQEKQEEAVINFKKDVLEILNRRFSEDGYIVPVVFGLVLKKGKLVIGVLGGLEQFFINREAKRTAPAVMKAFTDAVKPVAIAFATEAWIRIADNTKDVESDVPVSEHPDKIETLSVFFETFDKNANQLYTIHKGMSKSGKDLKEFKALDWTPKSKNMMTGQFINILTENYSETCEELKEVLRKSMN